MRTMDRWGEKIDYFYEGPLWRFTERHPKSARTIAFLLLPVGALVTLGLVLWMVWESRK